MTDEMIKLVVGTGVGGVIGIVSIGLLLWFARWTFANFRGVNQSLTRIERDLGRLLERNKLDSVPPPVEPETSKPMRLFPRKATPLPFFPVPQPDDDKEV